MCVLVALAGFARFSCNPERVRAPTKGYDATVESSEDVF